MGCGRTGATLAVDFAARGHTVAVIDMRQEAFGRLPRDFEGQRITGLGFDRGTLEAAGIDGAFAFAAVSDGDNSNILAARVARETYGVENVVARIADSERAEVYRRLGIATVAHVPWTVAQIVTRLLPGGSESVYTDAEGKVSLRRLGVHDAWVAQPYAALEAAAGTRVAYVLRFGEVLLPGEGTLIQAGDEVFLVVVEGATRQIEKVCGRPPGVAS